MTTLFPNNLDTFVNPTSADKLNGDLNPAVIHHIQHTDKNDAISAIETKLGINFSSVTSTVDFALQILEMTWMNHPLGGYKETTYVSNVFPDTIIWYTDSGKTIKLVEKDFTYGPGSKKFVTQVIWKLYDGTISNLLKRTITDNITLSGNKEISRIRTIS